MVILPLTIYMNESEMPQLPLYFRKLFSFPQYTWSQLPCKNNLSKSNSTIANIEVNLLNEHANLRILMRKQLTQLSKIVGLLETSCLTILHLNVTTLDAFVLYSISLKKHLSGSSPNNKNRMQSFMTQMVILPLTIYMNESEMPQLPLYFRKLFSFPQYTWSQLPCKNNLSKSNSTIANIEVNLLNEHANLRILMRKQLTQLSKIVGLLETSCLTILHLNVTTLDAFVLYSISLKVEEGCGLDSADEIANAVHGMLGLI
ncbi:myc-type, basic helix-loop-helix (bHLH) domain-containing protein [Artemisia annua]|uniref:Myc-type, basic helix-loop-helix (BHLH) domain-containing protein n=1 Tax=Artemisia annua TaxID=35608 RepID=A0A2U1KB13_ARTAN|nr:myc-type, basic helix-loop-helix (bHLH) domain-containing protein [Artemisia annua]